MADKFKNKYRIESIRLKNWDYRWSGAYFITICTQNRIHYFGEIENGKMILSNIGVIADILWHEIKNHTKNVDLGAFVVMPNHIHGILILNNNPPLPNDAGTLSNDVGTLPNDVGTLPYDVETLHATSLHHTATDIRRTTTGNNTTGNNDKNEFMSKISPKSGSVSTIIRSYKSAVTKHAHRLGYDFKWQARFYDHIIRDEKSFYRISQYIKNNPMKWENDKFYKQ